MGSDKGSPDERPAHPVSLKPFRISKFELQLKYWREYAAADRDAPEGCGHDDREPVGCISWEDVQRFVAWLNAHGGRGFRLPSEAEWEYAARAGSQSNYPWGDKDDPELRAHVAVGDLVYTDWSGRYPPNAFGLYDVVGNVSEWTADCYAPNYGATPATGAAYEVPACPNRVVRGGQVDFAPYDQRVSSRLRVRPSHREQFLGVRLAQSP
jgi:formylglycine-generating enzyme required for sulfatase activity